MSKSDIREALKKAAANHKDYIITGTVISVDEPNGFCTVESLSNKLQYEEVLISMGEAWKPIPAVGSIVCMVFLDGSEATACLVSYSELEALELVIGGKHHRFDSNGLGLNGAELGGLLIASAVTDKLNKVENRLNQLTNLFASHTHPVTAPNSPSGPTTPPVTLAPLELTISKDLENDEVKH